MHRAMKLQSVLLSLNTGIILLPDLFHFQEFLKKITDTLQIYIKLYDERCRCTFYA